MTESLNSILSQFEKRGGGEEERVKQFEVVLLTQRDNSYRRITSEVTPAKLYLTPTLGCVKCLVKVHRIIR